MLHHFDLAIAGSGIYGSALASILARYDVKVLLIERGQHPRFSLGEALLPQSAIWPFIIANRFDVPELGHLSHADRIVDHITGTCGLKHSIGFAWHEPEQPVAKTNLHQLIPPHLPFYSESHLYRADVDHFLVKSAIKRGVTYVDQTEITRIDINADAVTIQAGDRQWTAEVYVDASGRDSALVRQQGYRDGAPEAKTHSRTIFSHVTGLPPIDQWLDADSEGRRLHDGTFHHMFDGGWMWVIPFDNFSRSSSSLASVGLMLDPRKFPENSELSPEAEFLDIARRFPTMAQQFKDVKPTRPFVRTGRLQYAANTSVGDRHILAPSTYGFIDAIYSNGLVHTFESVFKTASALLSSFGKTSGPNALGDFSAQAFKGIDALHKAQWADADRMASSAYRAMRSSQTWGAWTQAWLAQVLFSDLWLQRACLRFFEAGDVAELDRLLEGNRPGGGSPLGQTREALLDDLSAMLDMSATSTEIADQMLARLRSEDWLPRHVYDWGNPAARSIDFSRPEVAGALLEWGFTASPPNLRERLFDFNLPSP